MRILEVGERMGTAAAGLALTALGNDVVQVRLPGRRVPPPEAAYYDRGRTVVEPGDLTRLVGAADVVLTDLDDGSLEAARVLVSIRSLGRWGPNAGYRMTELTEWAAGGIANSTRTLRPDTPEMAVPLVPPGHQPQALAGLAAASAALAAHRWSSSSGEPVVADVSVQEVLASTLHSSFPNFVWNGSVIGHPSYPSASLGLLLPAADGDVYIRTVEAHQWEKVMDWIGNPEWGELLGADPDDRLANRETLRTLIGEWTSTQPREALMAEGQRRHVPIALPRSLADVLAWQHLRARGVWCDLGGGEVPRLPMLEPPAWAPTRAARLDEVWA